jgi:hypothetical protein
VLPKLLLSLVLPPKVISFKAGDGTNTKTRDTPSHPMDAFPSYPFLLVCMRNVHSTSDSGFELPCVDVYGMRDMVDGQIQQKKGILA